jgi:hypothetical protein
VDFDINVDEERATDRISFTVAEHFKFDFLVRGLDIHSGKKQIECDLVGVRRRGGEYELECFETKLGCVREGKFNDLVRQIRARAATRLFRRIWGVWDTNALVAAEVDASFGTLRIANRGSLGQLVVPVCYAPRRDVTLGRDYERVRGYLRQFDTCPALKSGPHVFLKCPGCSGVEKFFYPHSVTASAHDPAFVRRRGDHAPFCPLAPNRQRFVESFRHTMEWQNAGRWIASYTSSTTGYFNA